MPAHPGPCHSSSAHDAWIIPQGCRKAGSSGSCCSGCSSDLTERSRADQASLCQGQQKEPGATPGPGATEEDAHSRRPTQQQQQQPPPHLRSWRVCQLDVHEELGGRHAGQCQAMSCLCSRGMRVVLGLECKCRWLGGRWVVPGGAVNVCHDTDQIAGDSWAVGQGPGSRFNASGQQTAASVDRAARACVRACGHACFRGCVRGSV